MNAQGRGSDLIDSDERISGRQLGNDRPATTAGESATNDRYEALVLHSPYCIHELDAQGILVSMNPAGLRMMGAEDDPCAVIGTCYLDAVCERDRSRIERLLLEAQKGRYLEFEFEAANGRMFRSNFVPLPVRADSPVRMMGITQDVTERRELERQLGRDRRMEAVGRLAGGMAHDFNNLLTVILGTASLLAAKVDEELQAEVEAIGEAARRGASLTSQLLAFARRQFVRPQILDLRRHLRRTEGLLERLLPENVRLDCVFDDQPLTVEMDPGQVDQLLLNLAANARDAMPRGGVLRLEVDRVFVDSTQLANRTDLTEGRYVRLRFSDTGCGMSPEVAERAFEPFYSTKNSAGGSGLGLATCHGIVSQSRGGIEVNSRPGKGSSFTIHLPFVEADADVEDAELEHPEPGASASILVVEDDELVLATVRRTLSAAGYEVLEAESGESALDRARRHAGDIDLLLTDVVLPGMDGLEVAERIREQYPEISVLYTSGYAEGDLFERIERSSDADIIAKPYEPEGLVGKIATLLAARCAPKQRP